MAIAKNPNRNQMASGEREAQAFISGAGKAEAEQDQNKRPIMIRIDPEILARVDAAAKRLGISRSAFIVSSAAMRLDSME